MSTENLTGIIFAVVFAAFIALILWQRSKSRAAKAAVAGYAAAQMQKIINSLDGNTAAVPGVNPRILHRGALKPEILAGIREGFRERIVKAQTMLKDPANPQSGFWDQGLAPEIYTVMVFPAVRDYSSDGTYSPSFQVFFNPGDPYDESGYDQEPGKPGGWTFAAEQVLTSNGFPVDVFIIADNNSEQYSALATANGLDHLFAYKNNQALYESTKDHSGGGGHPLW
jgi:hypothetical protein